MTIKHKKKLKYIAHGFMLNGLAFNVFILIN